MQSAGSPRTGRLLRAIVRLAAPVVTLAVVACDSPIAVDTTDPAQTLSATGTGTIEVWGPGEGAWLSGTYQFRALLKDQALDRYRMYWKVDSGGLVAMEDSYEGTPHKRASVGFGGWTWNGSGPYRVTFVAKDLSGNTVAERGIDVFVGTPPSLPAGNPFAGATFWVDPNSQARRQADAWRATRPADAAQLDRIASRPQADWFGDWNADVQTAVRDRVSQITGAGGFPVLVAYNIPLRDCNLYSAGGASGPDAYRAWIRAFAAGIGTRRAAVILEPDGLAAIDCLDSAAQQTRLALIREAVQVLKQWPAIAVYVDAGNGGWQPVQVMAERLKAAGIDRADGFALNVSNFHTTARNVTYGEALSAAVGGKHFVVDTSRNGLGGTAEYDWCNAPGRGLGHPPTLETGHPLVDAYLWIKRPGESDGTCNGGPQAGWWWAEYALELAANMPQTLAMLP